MTEEQKAFLDHILPLENWKNDYNPGSADPLKWNHEKFDTKFLNEHKKEFMVVWAQMLPHNLNIYVEAYMRQTYWFWAPVQRGTIDCYYSIETYADNQWLIDFTRENGIHDQPLLPNGINSVLRKFYGLGKYYFREGICFWLLLFSAVLLVLKNRRVQDLLLYVPGLLLWLTIMVSTPVSSSLRYVFVFVYTLPIYFGLLFFRNE